MTLPAGISTATVSIGSAVSPFDDAGIIKVVVKPNYGGATRIIHSDTGTILPAFTRTYTAVAGASVSFELPHVDQPGFLAPNGDAFTMWSYIVTVTISNSASAGENITYSQTVQPLVGQDNIDLDLVEDDDTAEPTETASVPAVLSVDGQTGHVSTIGGGVGGGTGFGGAMLALAPALGPFRAGLARRTTAPCRIVVLGGATVSGTGATTTANRFVNRLIARIQGSYPSGLGTEKAVVALGNNYPTPDNTVGVQGYNGGGGTGTVTTYVNGTNLSLIYWTNPHLIIHLLDSAQAVSGTNAISYAGNIVANIESIDEGVTNASHLIVHSYRDPSVSVDEWADYHEALLTLTDDLDNVAVLDISGAYETLDHAGADPYDVLGVDETHQTNHGHALMADLIALALGAMPTNASGGGGAGTVTSVNGVAPDAGNVTITIADIEDLQDQLDGKMDDDAAGLPPGSVMFASKGDTWPARPTGRTDILVFWRGPLPSPSVVSSGTAGMYGHDVHLVTP